MCLFVHLKFSAATATLLANHALKTLTDSGHLGVANKRVGPAVRLFRQGVLG
jgi:hypothetical protein